MSCQYDDMMGVKYYEQNMCTKYTVNFLALSSDEHKVSQSPSSISR